MALDYKNQLTTVFNNNDNVSEQKIDEIISIVLEDQTPLSPQQKLEAMTNLLMDTEVPHNEGAVDNHEEPPIGVTTNAQQFDQHCDRLLQLFPDICPNYLREFCLQYETFNFQQIVDDLAAHDYVKADKDPTVTWEHLKQMLPDADPLYLKRQARLLVYKPQRDLEQFVQNAIENHDYPTMQQYLINKKLQGDLSVYLKKFSVTAYLNKVPDPFGTFLDPNRKPIFSEDVDKSDVEFALTFLYNHFAFQRKKEIAKIFSHYDRNLMKTFNRLKDLKKAFLHPRQIIEPNECNNVDLLQQIAFLKHQKQIKQFLKQKDERYRLALEEAKLCGLMQTCGCCFDEQLIPDECYSCRKGCIFCKECVKKGVEIALGREETTFPCLANCDSEFDYFTLNMVLDARTYEGICHRKQIEEVRKANLDGLETCPRCDFSMIPDEEDTIFKCRNIECMAETCRKCHHEAHVPKRCNEIEYEEDVKMRTFIENKMTEAFLRKCWKCSRQFYKESGCNKMTCTCGAMMCYICGQAVADYSHFSSSGCPLFTENLRELHLNRVLEAVKSAKDKLGITENPELLKIDPAKGAEDDVV